MGLVAAVTPGSSFFAMAKTSGTFASPAGGTPPVATTASATNATLAGDVLLTALAVDTSKVVATGPRAAATLVTLSIATVKQLKICSSALLLSSGVLEKYQYYIALDNHRGANRY